MEDKKVINLVTQRLKEERKKSNFTQEKLGEIIGLDGRSYGNIERGSRNLTVDNARILANLYGVRIEYLLGEEEDRTIRDLNFTNFREIAREDIALQTLFKKFGIEEIKTFAILESNGTKFYIEDDLEDPCILLQKKKYFCEIVLKTGEIITKEDQERKKLNDEILDFIEFKINKFIN